MTSAWTETKQRARAAREAALASTFLALPEDLMAMAGALMPAGRGSLLGPWRRLPPNEWST